MKIDWKAAFARVKAALVRRGRTLDEAEDLVQEAWLRLACYQLAKSVDNPEAFLMRTALNLSIDAHRSQVARGQAVMLEDAMLVDSTPSAETIVLGRERALHLSKGLARLNENTCSILLAHRYEGLSYQEIADRHKVSVSAVEKQIAKAMLQVTMWMQGWEP